ncbi:hypothetical protein M0R45_018506 [Rubus argutus]|uniref:Uncharacterized protein n=1 Tax=Rubus argutus TaxID=59490 RepID=A0AAW1X427_RUBAR
MRWLRVGDLVEVLELVSELVSVKWAELETGLETLQGLGGAGCDLAVMAARVDECFGEWPQKGSDYCWGSELALVPLLRDHNGRGYGSVRLEAEVRPCCNDCGIAMV